MLRVQKWYKTLPLLLCGLQTIKTNINVSFRFLHLFKVLLCTLLRGERGHQRQQRNQKKKFLCLHEENVYLKASKWCFDKNALSVRSGCINENLISSKFAIAYIFLKGLLLMCTKDIHAFFNGRNKRIWEAAEGRRMKAPWMGGWVVEDVCKGSEGFQNCDYEI